MKQMIEAAATIAMASGIAAAQTGAPVESVPLNPRADATGAFTTLNGSQTGLQAGNSLAPENMRKYLLNGAGLATGDYDLDGFVDLYLIVQDGPNKLYRQTAPWTFEDVTRAAGDLSGGSLKGTGTSFADIDNDGDPDLYVCNADGRNMLYINQGDGTFTEEAAARGVSYDGPSTMAAFCDYDRDGDLDLYLLNNRLYSVTEEAATAKLRLVDGVPQVHPDYLNQYFLIEGRVSEAGNRDILFRNDGNGNFEDVTDSAGIDGHDMGLSANWWDFDDDGWLDLYVCNDLKSPDRLYHNRGDGTFREVLDKVVPHTPWFSMGADTADLNDDGVLDLLIADMSSTNHYKQKTTMGEMGDSNWFLKIGNPRQFMRNALLLSSGSRRFMEGALLTGLDSTDWSWAIRFGDYDNDGRSDVFITNGVGRNMNDSDLAAEYTRLLASGQKEAARNQLLEMPPLNENNLAFRNDGDLAFTNVAKEWGLDHFGITNGACMTDIDRDGDLDLIVSHMNEPLGVYRNDINDQNAILVSLRGTTSNRHGVGAKITIETESGTQVRQVILSRGYMSADEPITHFGLGNDTVINRLTIRWPDGQEQTVTNLQPNRHYTITEQNTTTPTPKPKARPQFAGMPAPLFTHRETPYDDYAIQPLLPNKLSQLGPAVAWADVNGDGQLDCFVGGAAGQPGAITIRGPRGWNQSTKPFEDAKLAEDMGALFFDADGDGDEDLYVASGGYEFDQGSKHLQDRLYINNGSGGFSLAWGALPDRTQSGSCVIANDLDMDGDLDLFVGSRMVPKEWPSVPKSAILRNNGGRFQDITDQVAPGLASIGLVTGALWSDMDNDGDSDLFVTAEWGAVHVFRNQDGRLQDVTEQAGLADDTGWWNSIAGGDLDGDGDIDYIATNFGLNTKYHGDHEHPIQLFVNDFDGDGTADLVEAKYEGETCYPVRGRSCSSNAMPFIADKFETYHDFALADVVDIYTPDQVAEARVLKATRLENVALINDGTGRFEIRVLPRLAQISPAFGVVISDLDLDGDNDVFLAQNFMNPQPETGQMDGGLGLVLHGDNSGNFDAVVPGDAGISIPYQGSAATIVDFDNDQRPDLVVATNDGPTLAFRNLATGRGLYIDIDGPNGNKRGVGAKVTVQRRSGKNSVHELHAGSGYLSQSAPGLFVANLANDPVTAVTVRWPSGATSSVNVAPNAARVSVGANDG